uniref:NADH dehydrogenase subunit 6 n=1 Tax=Pselliophora bifascipennis TaxID=3081712 RepID=UPI002A7EF84E|nr:NADH dehydrogenase subunit 6 [Pselliophora bifascipennis]WOE90383.1 NADH dehydrogenase subunit 6 [Pselliophora bifascipennis]
MMQFIFILSSIIISFLFTQMKHPLSMGFILLIQTFFICLITGSFMKTFWFSYVLFLIFIGGMLVLFIYMTSLASNETFNFSMKNFMLSFMILSLFIILILIMNDSTILNSFFLNNETTSITNEINLIKENYLNLNKLYNFPTNMLTLMLINYLFLTLIIIVKITNNFFGPLRQIN